MLDPIRTGASSGRPLAAIAAAAPASHPIGAALSCPLAFGASAAQPLAPAHATHTRHQLSAANSHALSAAVSFGAALHTHIDCTTHSTHTSTGSRLRCLSCSLPSIEVDSRLGQLIRCQLHSRSHPHTCSCTTVFSEQQLWRSDTRAHRHTHVTDTRRYTHAALASTLAAFVCTTGRPVDRPLHTALCA